MGVCQQQKEEVRQCHRVVQRLAMHRKRNSYISLSALYTTLVCVCVCVCVCVRVCVRVRVWLCVWLYVAVFVHT